MTIYSYKRNIYAAALAAMALLAGCTKDIPKAVPNPVPVPTGQSVYTLISTDANYSFLKAAADRAGTGITNLLRDSSAVFTMFAPTNAAFIASGIPSIAAINAGFRTGQLDTLLKYHIIPGQKYTASAIPATFPNLQSPTAFVLSAPFFRMSSFPSKQGASVYVNNLPITTPDITVANGVVHAIPFVLLPPDKVIAQITGADPDLTYFNAAVARADSGQTADLSKFSYLMAYPPVNFTVFAPTNAAFVALLTASITQALVAQGVPLATAQAQAAALASTPAVFSNPALYGALSAQTVRALIAYHVLGVKAYGINVPTASTNVATQLVVAPGTPAFTVAVQRTGTAVTVKGNVNTTASNVTTADLNAINGIVHKIDQVLRPL